MEFGVSKFELCHPFVKEGFDKYGTRFEDDEDDEDEEHLSIKIDKQEAEILDLRKAMKEFKSIMKYMSKKNFKQECLTKPHHYGDKKTLMNMGNKTSLKLLEVLLYSNMAKRLVPTYTGMKLKVVIGTTN